MSGRPRVVHETRAKRARRDFWKRFFIWVFILVFGFSVAGGIIAFTVAR
jgi:hypothetical protein